jgi:hypothetical protein
LRYDDPPAINLDLENQMNVAPGGFVTPGPHGPQVIPGVYTLKLIVDGQSYTQSVTVRNDPRVGESPKVMADLSAKNKLMMLAYQGAKDSFAGNSEVLAIRQQVASLNPNQLPEDVAKATKDIDVKLASFGGVVAGHGEGGFGGRRGETPPGAIKPFNTLNGSFNAIVSTSQVGLDEAPTQAQIDSWEAACKDYNATVAAWKKTQSEDLVAFSALLSKSHLSPLQMSPSTLSNPACTFAATAAPAKPSAKAPAKPPVKK